ncbi:AAA family ATPase [Sorangium sp. So ce185]|uniref:tetratricopeptide repeat protein n=1 Tax=Sorangium sp. So ce185 TaxID=3133287 RepID=UPI003F61DD9B
MNPLVPDFILQQDALGRAEGSFTGAALRIELAGLVEIAEALMPHGRAGAEELARSLQACFDPLIEAVHRAGGFIARLTGDGFTALFPDAPERDVAEHALAAALSMRRLFAERPARQTPSGSFPLSFRMGIAWGAVEWGIVRISPERAYYHFRGQALSECAALERQAQTADILIGRALYERLRPGRAGRHGRKVYKVGDAPVRELPEVPRCPPAGDGAAFVASGVAGVPSEGELREVTSVFLSFEQIPGVAELTRLLHELSDLHGGTFTGVEAGDLGVSALIHFGAPITLGNDNDRALDFALELKKRGLRQPRLRVGIARGVGYVGLSGGAGRRELACLGRATRLAARLAEKAPWSAVWVDAQVFSVSEAGYQWRTENLFRFEGLDLPVLVYSLQRRRISVHKEFYKLGLLGREAELELLSRHVEPIFEGKPAGIIYIDGEAGMGKSYLVQRFRDRCEERRHDRPFLWRDARCDPTLRGSLNALEFALKEHFRAPSELGKEERLTSFDDALESLLERLPASQRSLKRELERARSVLAALIGVRWDDSPYERLQPKHRYTSTLSVLCCLFMAEASLQPVILHLEDAHWADAGSREAVRVIAQVCKELPLAILCTARSKEDGSPVRIPLDPDISVRAIEMKPLSREQLLALALPLFGGPMPDILATTLCDRAGGNPFFAQEFLAHWVEDGRDGHGSGSSSASMTLSLSTTFTAARSVSRLLTSRIERLDAKVKQTVAAAAVIGREFDLRVLALMLADASVMEEHLRIGEAECIWSAKGERRFQFSSTLLRDAAYDSQSRPRLQELHRLAAEAIESVHGDDLEGQLVALGHHCRRAGKVDDARRYFLAGARRAAARYAHEDATCFYRIYFKLSPGPTRESVAVRSEFARDVLERMGRYPEAQQEHRQAVNEAQKLGDRASEALGLLGLGRACWAMQQPDGARAYWEEGLRAAREAGNPATEGDTLASLGMAHAVQGRVDAARALYAQALEIAGQTGNRIEEARLLSELAKVNRLSGRPAGAAAVQQQAAAVERAPASGKTGA